MEGLESASVNAKKAVIVSLFSMPPDRRLPELDQRKESDIMDKEAKLTAPGGSYFQFHPVLKVSRVDMSRALAEKNPLIIHFSGHGRDDGSLVVENDRGELAFYTPDSFSLLVQTIAERGNLRLVLLNCCHSATTAKMMIENKVAKTVIGMNGEVGDSAAITFAQVFYQQIFLKMTLAQAFKIAVSTLDSNQKHIPIFNSEEPDHVLLEDAVRIVKGSIPTNPNPTQENFAASNSNSHTVGGSAPTPAPPKTDEDIWYELTDNRELVRAVGYGWTQMLAKFPAIRIHKQKYTDLGAKYDQIGFEILYDLSAAGIGIADFVKTIDKITEMRALAYKLSQTYKVPLK